MKRTVEAELKRFRKRQPVKLTVGGLTIDAVILVETPKALWLMYNDGLVICEREGAMWVLKDGPGYRSLSTDEPVAIEEVGKRS